MLRDYAPILVLLVLALAFALGTLLFSELLGGHRSGIDKAGPYECGMRPRGDARVRVSIHFYLVAVLFILFDVESIFLIPWAVAAKSFSSLGVAGIVFAEVLIFVGILGAGLAYVWRRGGLDWDR